MTDPGLSHLETAPLGLTGSSVPPATDTNTPTNAPTNTPLRTADLPPAAIPERIGRYQIVRLIGSGGMGAVYEAIQDQPKRTVALKVIRASLATPAMARRFEYESQLLAKLRHPGIAQVYDAGTHAADATDHRVPYFAMEYIPDARTLVEYARIARLSTRQRLDLFVKVCDAIHHAHLRGVIHRDLKPANILVDTAGAPKIIDFGVAASTEPDAALTIQTNAAPMVGTLQYMSPEQCAEEAADIDARADVFALGLILSELLTGHPAYTLAGKPLPAVLKVIREGAVPKPSTRDPALRGDLDTIVLKAAAHDRQRRYDSAAALADDVTRHLRYEPILARPIGPLGRLARLIRRNQAAAAVAAASLIILVGVTTFLATRIVAETRRTATALAEAQRNLRAERQNVDLMRGIFDSMDPSQLQKGLVDVGYLLDTSAQKISASPPEFPATEADFREFLANGYRGLGLYAKAIAQQRRVVDIRQNILPDPSPELANSLHLLGASYWWNGETDEAGKIYERSLDMRRRLYNGDHPQIAFSLTHLAACRARQARLREAKQLHTEALDMRQRLEGPQGPNVAASLNNLAKVLDLLGESTRAEDLFKQAYTMIKSLSGPGDLRVASAAYNLGTFLLEVGKPDQAEPLMREALEIRAARFRKDHHQVSLARLGLARARFGQSPSDTTLAEAKDALDAIRATLPPGHPDVGEAYTALGRMYMTLKRPTDAESLLRQALQEYQASPEASARVRALAHLYLAECQRDLGDINTARATAQQGQAHVNTIPDLAPVAQRLQSFERSLDAESAANNPN